MKRTPSTYLLLNHKMKFTTFELCIIFICIVPLIHAQQPYIRQPLTSCGIKDNSHSELGYFCNGLNKSCQSYLTFRSRPPYNTVSSISALLGSDPSKLSQLNLVSLDSSFETDKLVIVPVTCSCSGQYYQSNVTYAIKSADSYFVIAKYAFQGLSTCQAVKAENNRHNKDLIVGDRFNVPLRCACTTKNQSDAGVNFLLSYLIVKDQNVYLISRIFGVDGGKTLSANGLSLQDSLIYPDTTLLVPLQYPPVISKLKAPSPPPPRAPSTQPVPSRKSPSKTWLYVVVVVVVVLALITGGVVFFVFFFRKKNNKGKSATETCVTESFESTKKPLDKSLNENSEEFLSSIASIAQSLDVYKFEELELATDEFSPNCLIEGSVYRGVIRGDLVAIKRMNGDVQNEINLLSKINHLNLIRLLGVCFGDGHWYLVYEYASNGSLSDWIFKNTTHQKFLNWTQRIQIILDIAMGLNYLHSYASPPHVHRDLRSSNILLDDDMRAKIANFSLARSAEDDEGLFALTRHIVGTKGYISPEYLENGLVSPKLDVYSFGVVLLEILSGKGVDWLYEGVKGRLLDILVPLIQEECNNEQLVTLMDPNLEGNYPAELSMMLIRLCERCLSEDLSLRPSMGEIVQSLSTIIGISES